MADRFYAQLDDKLQQILTHPYLYAVRYSEVRCVQLERFPYLVHYYVEVEEQQITVLGVIHTSRDPLEGTERL
ncbi:type II toxin-antitoxin system RelE/ParE family toxin [Tunicatimonas pelagia]|uniref:type II toxin-antitoxin system RelE/ParE family toxin n=1 Tax=Tunicatimonas pelagia TaxID=931531 RepID=UPI002665EE07|nr:type II toxin-antitoxin system RelE/ParE family toxin [Tunicatimonas pelagia]WKN40735.1 type II toxin-antitoxin system RelE/ParE family toxin [Tunicatimonas pelagia]